MIEKILAEIKRRTDILTRIYAEQVERKDEELQTYYHGKIVALEELRSFIESLEKEPHYTKRNAIFDECVKNCDPKIMKKVSDEIDKTLEKEKPKGLDEAAESYSNSPEPLYSPGHRFHWDNDALFGMQIETAFKAGAKWMAEQGVSMEITTEVDWTDIDKFVYKHSGDNVIIQMRKKEE